MGWVYLLRCADGSYYVGSTTDLPRRLGQHQTGVDVKAYTFFRRPVELVWCQQCPSIQEAYAFEKRVRGWSRAKKEALIRGDWDEIHRLVKQERLRKESRKRSGEPVEV
jgi:predicted GIY-YIG superfamily endonuclease